MIRRSKKAEMSFALIVAIVLGLIIIAISAYMIYDKSRQAQSIGKCEALGGDCVSYATKECPAGQTASLTPCKTKGTDGKLSKIFDGRCCYPEE